MRYPFKCNYISYEKNTSGEGYIVTDYWRDRTMMASASDIAFIEKLDGNTDPLKLARKTMSSEQAISYVFDLERKGLIRFGKTLIRSWGMFARTLIIFKSNDRYRIPAKILNMLLLIFLFPLLGVGAFCFGPVISGFLNGDIVVDAPGCYFGMAAAIIVGGIIHEYAHTMACISYGGRVYEIGVMFQGVPGAYTLMDHEPIKRRLHRIQTFIAGVESNIELSCIALILCRFLPEWSSFLIEFALINIDIALFNLLLIDGLDGTAVMGAILGDEELIKHAIEVIYDSRRDHRFKRYGLNGRIKILAAYMLGATKLFWPIMIGFNIAIVLGRII